jgi:uroporphyrinogen III methyltransferase / synthase
VITRPRRQAGELAGRIRDLGGRPLIFPTVEIIREPDLSGLHAALDELAAFSWIIFSSANAVEIFFDELAGRHADARVLAGVRVCAIGPGTARALRQQGITADLVPHSFCAEGILEELSPRLAPGARVLLPRAGNARDLLERDLPAAVTEVCLYRAHVPACVDEELLAHICRGEAEVVTFTSSSTVSNFVELIGAQNLDALASRAAIACIGPVTARTARACGLRVDIEADVYTVEGLIKAIVSWVGRQRTAAQDS